MQKSFARSNAISVFAFFVDLWKKRHFILNSLSKRIQYGMTAKLLFEFSTSKHWDGVYMCTWNVYIKILFAMKNCRRSDKNQYDIVCYIFNRWTVDSCTHIQFEFEQTKSKTKVTILNVLKETTIKSIEWVKQHRK